MRILKTFGERERRKLYEDAFNVAKNAREISDAQKKRLPYAQQVIDVDVRSYYYWWKKTSGLKGKKYEKISQLQDMGMDYRTALLWYEYVLK
jgi:hypothetical protein